MATENGGVDGKNKFKCFGCFYEWIERRGIRINYQDYYREYLSKKRTLTDIANILDISPRTASCKFNKVHFKQNFKSYKDSGMINLVLDATYFGRKYGYFCFSDGKKIIYFREIKTEGVKVFRECLRPLQDNLGYRFQNFILNGKRGFINNLKKLYLGRPVQMCHFHQKAIIRRYITDKPQSKCG